jgi:hypothetical protein
MKIFLNNFGNDEHEKTFGCKFITDKDLIQFSKSDINSSNDLNINLNENNTSNISNQFKFLNLDGKSIIQILRFSKRIKEFRNEKIIFYVPIVNK